MNTQEQLYVEAKVYEAQRAFLQSQRSKRKPSSGYRAIYELYFLLGIYMMELAIYTVSTIRHLSLTPPFAVPVSVDNAIGAFACLILFVSFAEISKSLGISYEQRVADLPFWYYGLIVSLLALGVASTVNWQYSLVARWLVIVIFYLIILLKVQTLYVEKNLQKIEEETRAKIEQELASRPEEKKIHLCTICAQESQYDICLSCEKITQPERHRLRSQIMRAKQAGTPATLTIVEWLTILNTFGWRCAYCHGKYECMEHYVPITQGGGTTADNCVPACFSCNSKKSGKHPETDYEFPPKRTHTPSSAAARARVQRTSVNTPSKKK